MQPDERVIDWFCGLGNFTLPLATPAREVLGIEGSDTLVARAGDNLALNRAATSSRPALGATTESCGPGPASGWYCTQPAGTSSRRRPSIVPS